MSTTKYIFPVTYQEDGVTKKSHTEQVRFEIDEDRDELLIRIDHGGRISLCLSFKPEEAFLIRDSLSHLCELLPGWNEGEGDSND